MCKVYKISPYKGQDNHRQGREKNYTYLCKVDRRGNNYNTRCLFLLRPFIFLRMTNFTIKCRLNLDQFWFYNHRLVPKGAILWKHASRLAAN